MNHPLLNCPSLQQNVKIPTNIPSISYISVIEHTHGCVPSTPWNEKNRLQAVYTSIKSQMFPTSKISKLGRVHIEEVFSDWRIPSHGRGAFSSISLVADLPGASDSVKQITHWHNARPASVTRVKGRIPTSIPRPPTNTRYNSI